MSSRFLQGMFEKVFEPLCDKALNSAKVCLGMPLGYTLGCLTM